VNSPNERVGAETRLLDGETLAIADVVAISRGARHVAMSEAVLATMARNRAGLEALAERGVPIYGVNTGFGEMVHNWVDPKDARALQENLLRSHCAGVGETFARDEARAMMVARANSLARGYSAIRPEVVSRLLDFLNLGITPAIPQVGSLGASGDLAPLAAMAITLIGEGYVLADDGAPVPTKQLGLPPLALQYKEALSLINGTSAMTGLACLVLEDPRSVALGSEPVRIDGKVAGRVTSGGYGYTVKKSIAYAYVPASAAAGTPVEVEIFGAWVSGEIAKEPLYDPRGDKIRN